MIKNIVFIVTILFQISTGLLAQNKNIDEFNDICALDHEDLPPSKYLNTIKSINYPGASINFPVTGDVNALIVFVQRKDDLYEDCRRFLGYNNLGEPQFEPSINYSYCANRPNMQDSWEINGVQSLTDNPTTEWPANLPDSTHPRYRQLPAWASGIIDPPNSSQITEGSLTDIYI